MTKSNPQERMIASQSASFDGTQKSLPGGAQSLPAEDIESLLKFARESVLRQTTEQVEELGPGDVQYLRGNAMTHTNSASENAVESNWPGLSRDPDAILQQAERQLAEAILDSGQSPLTSGTRSGEFGIDSSRAFPRTGSRQGLTLEDLGNLELDITIELGRAEILIEDVLKLREGSVVSLDKLAGDPVDIMANGRLVARGELLVIDGKFGVRLSEVL